MTTRQTIARNFVANHGLDGLRKLVDALAAGRSGQEIADEFQVSRERVRQWKNAFGQSVTMYQVFPDVLQVLHEGTVGRGTR